MFGRPGDRRAHRLMRNGGTLQRGLRDRWIEAVLAIDPDLVVDVGANYGEMLLPLGSVGAARLVAVEPSPLVYPYLLQSISSCAELCDRTEVVTAAVGSRSGDRTVSLDLHLEYSGTSRLSELEDSPRESGSVRVQVKTTGLASLLSPGTRTVAVKLDVEGAEIVALQDLFRDGREIPSTLVLLEVEHIDLQQLAAVVPSMHVFAVDRESSVVTYSGAGVDVGELEPSVACGAVHDVFMATSDLAPRLARAWGVDKSPWDD